MSIEQLQHFQSLIQSNPELKQQLINYLTVDRILNITPDIIIILVFAMFIVYSVSDNNKRLLKLLFSIIVITIIVSMTAYLITPFIAPDVYLHLQTK